MESILTRCGYRCDLCLAYRPNVEQDPSNRQILSDGWFKYFGFRIPPEKILCDGCMAEAGLLIDNACPVRPCVIETGVDNCAACPDYGCEKLIERFVIYADLAKKLDGSIPDEDRKRFIEPYENKNRLDKIRNDESISFE